MIRLLVIEDEAPIRRFLRASLDNKEFELFEAESGREGVRQFATRNPDVVILDLGLPDIDGIEVARTVRQHSQVPIIVLSSRSRDEDKVSALDAGADDYLTKPFSVAELSARIRVALRHKSAIERMNVDDTFESGDLKADLRGRRIWVGDKRIHLTPSEFKLLSILIRNSGRVVTHKELLTEIWGGAYSDASHLVRVFVCQLRHKIEVNPTRPKYLITEPGIGYRIEV